MPKGVTPSQDSELVSLNGDSRAFRELGRGTCQDLRARAERSEK